MSEFINSVLGSLQQKPLWELVAVLLGVAYLVLAMKQSIWCWLCALLSTAIYIVLFWQVSLKMESALNVYYLFMAGYGYWVWQRKTPESGDKPVITWRPSFHIGAIGLTVTLTYLSGTFLSNYSTAAWPYLDSFTTWGAVITTYMVAQKVLENWIYWLIIDAVSVYLYLDRGLYFTVVLFAIYLVLVVFGFFEWRKALAQQTQDAYPVPA